MRFAAALAFFAGLAAAQTTTTAAASAATACPAENIVDACLDSTNTRLQACSLNDWSCMCTAQQAVVTCFNNCPQDTRAPAANSQLVAWCNAASLAPSTSTAIKTAASSTLATTAATTSSANSTSSTAAAKTGAAGIIVPGSGAFILAIGAALL